MRVQPLAWALLEPCQILAYSLLCLELAKTKAGQQENAVEQVFYEVGFNEYSRQKVQFYRTSQTILPAASCWKHEILITPHETKCRVGWQTRHEDGVLKARYWTMIVACLWHAGSRVRMSTPHCASLRYAYVGLLRFCASGTRILCNMLPYYYRISNSEPWIE